MVCGQLPQPLYWSTTYLPLEEKPITAGYLCCGHTHGACRPLLGNWFSSLSTQLQLIHGTLPVRGGLVTAFTSVATLVVSTNNPATSTGSTAIDTPIFGFIGSLDGVCCRVAYWTAISFTGDSSFRISSKAPTSCVIYFRVRDTHPEFHPITPPRPANPRCWIQLVAPHVIIGRVSLPAKSAGRAPMHLGRLVCNTSVGTRGPPRR